MITYTVAVMVYQHSGSCGGKDVWYEHSFTDKEPIIARRKALQKVEDYVGIFNQSTKGKSMVFHTLEEASVLQYKNFNSYSIHVDMQYKNENVAVLISNCSLEDELNDLSLELEIYNQNGFNTGRTKVYFNREKDLLARYIYHPIVEQEIMKLDKAEAGNSVDA